MADQLKAAFFRVEGTLVKRPRIAAPAYFTLNSQTMSTRLTRLSGLALAAGLKIAGPMKDQHVVHRMAWMGLRGMGEDRLAVLGEEYYERHVLRNLNEVGLDLLAEARRQGYRIILLSELLDAIIAPLQAHLKADDLLCNVMEMRNGRATGRLAEPLIGGTLSGQWARSWANANAIDLDASCGYGANGGDSLLLSAIGKPCAVDPDWRLRRIAKDLDWPVVDG